MPTYMLEGSGEVSLAPRPLTLTLKLDGAVPGRLEILQDGTPYAKAVSRPGVDIIPTVDAPLVVRIVPAGAVAHFPAGAVATLSISTTVPGGEPERVILSALQLEGLAGSDAVTVSRKEGRFAIAALSTLQSSDSDLSPVGRAARVAASEILGAHRVDEGEQLDLIVAVDDSASFRLRVVDGSAATMLGILEGVSSIIGASDSTQLVAVGATQRQLDSSDGPLDDGARALAETGAASTGITGSISTSGLVRRAENALVYLISDGIPADISALEADDRVPGNARHLVVLGHESAIGLLRAPETPLTTANLSELAAIAAEPVATDPRLRGIVRQLLQGCFAPGSFSYERVTS